MNTAHLDESRLQNVHPAGGKTLAQCPACAETGNDKAGEHLVILAGGKFGCIAHPGAEGDEHRKRIFALAGVKGEQHSKPRIVATYDYQDAATQPIFQVVRYEPKDFRQRRPDPANPGQYIWNMNGVERVLYRLPEVLKAKADGRVIFLVEGERDADSCRVHGLTATCNAGGAGKWSDVYTATLTGAKVIIIADKDQPGRSHAALVLQALTGKAASVQVIELPDRAGRKVKDATDWFDAGGGVEELREIVKTAPAWVPPTEDEASDRRALTSPDNGRKGGRPAAPPASEIAFQFAEKQLRTADENLSIRHYRDQWYQFADGWSPVSDLEVEKRVITYLQDNPELAPFATNTYARNILRNLASFNLCGIDARVEMPCWLSSGEDARNWIAFQNIAVDVWSYAQQLADGKLPKNYSRPISPDLFSADFVSYEFDEGIIPERFIQYLERVQPNTENFNAVRRMLGLILADVQKFEVFYQLYGNGANGKTVLLDVIEALVGFRNVCRIPLESLAPGNRFQTWPLSVAKVNICGEIATDLGSGALAAIEGVFKHCVSGGVIEVEHKGRDKSTARCRARFVLSGNSLPTFIDKSNAIWRRLRIIPFPVDLPPEEWDADLAKKIVAQELPGIAVWALEGLAEVIAAGRVEECPDGLRKKDQHRTDCDHERNFLLDGFEPGSDDDRMPSAELYAEYRDWMLGNGYRPLGAGKFFTRVENVFPLSEVKFMRINGSGVRGIMRLRRRNVADVSPSTLAPV